MSREKSGSDRCHSQCSRAGRSLEFGGSRSIKEASVVAVQKQGRGGDEGGIEEEFIDPAKQWGLHLICVYKGDPGC